MQSLESLARMLRDQGQPGFQVFSGLAEPAICQQMLDDVVSIAEAAAAGEDVAPCYVAAESQEGFSGQRPEDFVSKIFKLHRRPVFLDFLRKDAMRDLVVASLGPDGVR